MAKINVVVPTIKGRERYLEACLASYEKNSVNDIHFTIVNDRPCVGTAWNDGAQTAALSRDLGEFLHLTNDDITACPGWDEAAIEAVGRGVFPSPQILDSTGRAVIWGRSTTPVPDYMPMDSTTVPFMTWKTWSDIGPCLDVHYYSDDWLSWKARMAGWPSAYVEGYKLMHHWAQEGRGAGMTEPERMKHDRKTYLEALEKYDEHDRHDSQ